MLLNNLVESFNTWTKEARSKPILTVVEDIRRQIIWNPVDTIHNVPKDSEKVGKVKK